MCDHFVDMKAPVKTYVENVLSKLFSFWGQTIDTSDQGVFKLKDPSIHDEEGKKMNTWVL